MAEEQPGRGDPIGPLDWLELIPIEPAAASDRLGWVGLEAVHFRAALATEFNQPDNTHHMLVLYTRPPEELHARYEGVKRHVPPPAGSVSLIPAGSPAWVRLSGCRDQLHVFLEPGLMARVAAEAFGLDPARTTVPPFYGLDLPHLRATMLAVEAELTAGRPGGPLAAESLANVLAVHLIRHVLAPRRPERGRDGALPRGRLRAIVEYVASSASLASRRGSSGCPQESPNSPQVPPSNRTVNPLAFLRGKRRRVFPRFLSSIVRQWDEQSRVTTARPTQK